MRSWKLIAVFLLTITFALSVSLIFRRIAFPRHRTVRVGFKSDSSLECYSSPEDAAIVNAVFAGDATAVKRLLKLGANPNAVIENAAYSDGSVYSQGAIHVAARRGDVDVLQALIDGGANANGQDSEGRTPLMTLCELRSAQDLASCVDVLCRAGADPDGSDSRGFRPLHLAVLKGKTKYAELLLGHGANVNGLNGATYTPMVLACACFPNTDVGQCSNFLFGAVPTYRHAM